MLINRIYFVKCFLLHFCRHTLINNYSTRNKDRSILMQKFFCKEITNGVRVEVSVRAGVASCVDASRMHTWYPRRGSTAKWKLVFDASLRTRATPVSGPKINFTHQNHFAKYVPTWHLDATVSSVLAVTSRTLSFKGTLSAQNVSCW